MGHLVCGFCRSIEVGYGFCSSLINNSRIQGQPQFAVCNVILNNTKMQNSNSKQLSSPSINLKLAKVWLNSLLLKYFTSKTYDFCNI